MNSILRWAVIALFSTALCFVLFLVWISFSLLAEPQLTALVKIGSALAGVWLLAMAVWLGAVFWTLVQGMKGGAAPYRPAKKWQYEPAFALANITANDVVADLGSGDGVLVFESAKRGAKKAVGYEIDPLLLKISAFRKKLSSLSSKVEFRSESFWDADLSEFDVILMHQDHHVMKRFEQKIPHLKKGVRIVSIQFPFEKLQPQAQQGTVRLYTQ